MCLLCRISAVNYSRSPVLMTFHWFQICFISLNSYCRQFPMSMKITRNDRDIALPFAGEQRLNFDRFLNFGSEILSVGSLFWTTRCYYGDDAAAIKSWHSWIHFFRMMFFITLFSQVVKDYEFPMPCLSDGKCAVKRWPIFKLFPVSIFFIKCALFCPGSIPWFHALLVP